MYKRGYKRRNSVQNLHHVDFIQQVAHRVHLLLSLEAVHLDEHHLLIPFS